MISRGSTRRGTPCSIAAMVTVFEFDSVSRPLVIRRAIVLADGTRCMLRASGVSERRRRVAHSVTTPTEPPKPRLDAVKPPPLAAQPDESRLPADRRYTASGRRAVAAWRRGPASRCAKFSNTASSPVAWWSCTRDGPCLSVPIVFNRTRPAARRGLIGPQSAMYPCELDESRSAGRTRRSAP